MKPAPRPFRLLVQVVSAIALLAGLGAGAIALERPSGQVTGVVHSASKQALADASVVVSGPVTRTLYTDAEGKYSFNHLPVGDYYVSADAKGHDLQSQEDAIKVKEGEVLADVDFELAQTNPSLDVTNVQRVFTPEDTVRVTVRGNQVPALDVSLYKLDLAAAAGQDPELANLREIRPEALPGSKLVSRVRGWTLPVAPQNREDEDWFFQPVQVDKLTPGAYMVAVSGEPTPGLDGKPRARVADKWWFTVSKMALVTKRTDDQLVAWTTDLKTHRPVAGARITVFEKGRGARSGASAADGLARLPMGGSEHALVMARVGDDVAFTRAGHYAGDRLYDVYAFTDRPVYRPGQNVKFKGIVRARDAARRFVPVGDRTVTVKLKDSVGADLAEKTYPLNDASAFDGAFDLPENAALGEYRVEIAAGSDYEFLDFKVADYRKPEYKVEITPAKARYVRGEDADVELVASYYFGAPVPGAKLQVTVYSQAAYSDWSADEGFFASFFDDPGYEPSWGFGDVVQQTELVADAQGRAHLGVALPVRSGEDQEVQPRDETYTVAVEAIDASGRPVKARQAFLVTQADIKLRVEADQALYAGGKAIGVNLKTATHDDKPVSTNVEVKVVRLESVARKTADGDEYDETVRKPVYTGSVKTDARGLGTLSVPSPGDGSYEIVATARDGEARPTTDMSWAWVAGEDGGGSYRYGAIQVLLDKKVYKPGDVAKALVVSPVPDLTVLLTVEGTRLHEARAVRLKGTSALVSLPVREGYKPNAFVAVAAVNGKEYMEAEKSLNVLPEEKFLQVAVSTPKGRVEPGETVAYTVETRDWRGKPTAAEVTLGIVDEAVYAIEPDHTGDIKRFFHGPRWNMVSSAYSFAEDYSGGLDKFAPDPRVRAKFEDTAAWFPSIRTGANGRATVNVTLPDNLTTWVAAAHAATRDTRVGSASHRLIASKDLLVRLETPRFVVVGDHVVLSAIAHNYTPNAVDVDLALEATGLKLDAAAARRVTIKPGGAERVTWEAEVPAEGGTRARVYARPVGLPGHGDAMELPVPALAFGVEDQEAVATTAGPGLPGRADFTVPGDTLPGAEVRVQLHVTPLPAIAGAIAYLQGYPYGCVEQTMSRFLPEVALQPRLAAAGVPTADLFPGHATYVEDGMRRLTGMQHGDGGWGWWENDESKPEMTAYVLTGLAEARRDGARVPDGDVKEAVTYLKGRLPAIGKHSFTRETAKRNAGADVRAFVLYALSRWDAAPRDQLDRLFADRAELSPYGAAQLALALRAADDHRARRLVEDLRRAVMETETQASWTGSREVYSWHDSTTESTAWTLRALLAVEPGDPLVAKAVRWLESKNVDGRWSHTKDTAAAAIALADYLAIRKPAVPGGFSATVLVDDQAIGTYAPSAADMLKAAPPLEAPVAAGNHTLRVELTNGEAVDATAAVVFRRNAEGLGAAGGDGVTVSRRYLALPADVYAEAQGGHPGSFFNADTAKRLRDQGAEAKAGDRILVEVTIKTDKLLKWMALKDPLPAGCEILEDQPDNWAYWWDHQEYRDEEAAFFFSSLEPGTRTLYYVMRPTTPGRYRALPTQAWAMYTPEIRARGTATGLTIVE